MKKVCGYKSKSGRFFDKKSECELDDLEYDLKEVTSTLKKLETNLGEYMFLKGCSIKTKEFRENEKYLFDIVAKFILKDSDKFIEIINNKKKLSTKLDKLQTKINHNQWWLKYKWW